MQSISRVTEKHVERCISNGLAPEMHQQRAGPGMRSFRGPRGKRPSKREAEVLQGDFHGAESTGTVGLSGGLCARSWREASVRAVSPRPSPQGLHPAPLHSEKCEGKTAGLLCKALKTRNEHLSLKKSRASRFGQRSRHHMRRTLQI